jgi:hypothetical protein
MSVGGPGHSDHIQPTLALYTPEITPAMTPAITPSRSRRGVEAAIGPSPIAGLASL